MKLYIWGTGRLASLALGKYIDEQMVVGFIDNDICKTDFRGKKVFRPEEISQRSYDAIIVITLHSHQIYQQSRKLGFDLNKMVFMHNNFVAQDLNSDYTLIQKIFGKDYSNIIKSRCLLIRRNEAAETYGRVLESEYTETDYVRIKTFELISEEIKKNKLEGAVAEVGVFRGEFAQYINAAFPDRKCYLFDTFEGFVDGEAENEVKKGHATKAMVDAYKDTNIEIVMQKMRYPGIVEIRKGIFPNTLNGLEEKFVFVSIDVDFENSIFDCLSYFYPRVVGGGYIFIHDYNTAFKGVKNAVRKYQEENGRSLKMVPLCDANGTLVITK